MAGPLRGRDSATGLGTTTRRTVFVDRQRQAYVDRIQRAMESVHDAELRLQEAANEFVKAKDRHRRAILGLARHDSNRRRIETMREMNRGAS